MKQYLKLLTYGKTHPFIPSGGGEENRFGLCDQAIGP